MGKIICYFMLLLPFVSKSQAHLGSTEQEIRNFAPEQKYTVGYTKNALQYAKSCLKLADSINYSMFSADSYNNIGDVYCKHGLLDSAIVFYKKALDKANEGTFIKCGKYKVGIVDAYNKIGCALLKKNKLDEAFTNFSFALALSQDEFKTDYTLGIKTAQANIKIIRQRKGLRYNPLLAKEH